MAAKLPPESFEYGPESKALKFKMPDGWTVWQWPEWQALMKRLGVDLGTATTCLTIRVPAKGPTEILHEFFGLDLDDPR